MVFSLSFVFALKARCEEIARARDFLTQVSGALDEAFSRGTSGCARALREGSEFAWNSSLSLQSMTTLTSYPQVPSFGGKASSFASNEGEVISRNQISTIEPSRRAANLFLDMIDIARKGCAAVGKDHIARSDGAHQVLRIPRGRFSPDAIDATYHEVATFISFKRTD